MEIVYRERRHLHTDAGVDLRETELSLSSLDSAVAAILAVALAGGVALSGYDVADTLRTAGKVNIAASAVQTSPVRRRYDFDALCTRAGELARGTRQWLTEKALEHHATAAAVIQNIAGAADQLDIEWPELSGEDILALIHQYGGAAVIERDPATGVIDSITASFTEYDSAEMTEVLESLQASGGVTPKKLVGDLAQASIITTSGQEQIISLAEWTISWKRKVVEATTTDDALYESSLGSSKSWTVKAKFMFVDGDQSQVDGVLSAIDTTSLNAITWAFFPTVEQGRAAFSGMAFIDGIDIGSGSGKIVGLDVSLHGTGPLTRATQLAPVATTNTTTGVQGQI